MLPEKFGLWNSVYKRFSHWSRLGVFELILEQLSVGADREWTSVDSTVIRAHVSAAGACSAQGGQKAQSLGRSRGGFSTKIHIKVDALGAPLKFALTGGQRNDVVGFELLKSQEDAQAQMMLMDRGYDSNKIRDHLKGIGVNAVIPSKRNRSQVIPHDKEIYKHRYVVECFIGRIKWLRRIATRYDKLDTSYLSFIHFAACLDWLR